MMASPQHQTVAVVGLGGMGLVGVKNLVEEGFDVTGFESSSYVGGVWHYTEEEGTLSVLRNTQANVSVDRVRPVAYLLDVMQHTDCEFQSCYTDYPYPDGTPAYCSAREVEHYLESYVDHFDLRSRLRLDTKVTQITREDKMGKWRLDFESRPSAFFDKVVLATGPHIIPTMPRFEGADLFAGDIVHSKSFKKYAIRTLPQYAPSTNMTLRRPEYYKDKKVLLVGLGNTGGDIAEALSGYAEEISIAHNHGVIIVWFSRVSPVFLNYDLTFHQLPRVVNGLPATRLVTLRRLRAQGFLETYLPTVGEWFINYSARRLMMSSFGELDPNWGLDPAPSLKVSVPVVSDWLIESLRRGQVRMVSGIRRIVGPREVEMVNGEHIEVDSIICCTGYHKDFNILDPRYDPSSHPTPAWREAPGSKGRPLARLYQNVFSLEAPNSLAFLGCAWFATGAFFLADIASMCIAQVWAGKSMLPPPAEMDAWADEQERRICELAHRGTPIPASVPQREWLDWADKTAGIGLTDRLGWGAKGWDFWLRDRTLYRMLLDGVLTSAIWRLFDEGKRKPWDGAAEQIKKLNDEVKREKEAMERYGASIPSWGR